MTDLRKAAVKALHALEDPNRDKHIANTADAISSLRQALAQPEQEPVAWKDKTYGNLHHQNFGNSIPLYTAPPSKPKEWVSLTDDEKLSSIWTDGSFHHGVEWAEVKLKEKNT